MTEVKHTANNSFTLQSGWNHVTLNDGIKTRQTSYHLFSLVLDSSATAPKITEKRKTDHQVSNDSS